MSWDMLCWIGWEETNPPPPGRTQSGVCGDFPKAPGLPVVDSGWLEVLSSMGC